MKKWEKPTLQNLALNYTEEHGIEPVFELNRFKYCPDCCAQYRSHGAENGQLYVFKTDSGVLANEEGLFGTIFKCGVDSCQTKPELIDGITPPTCS